jgi:hypothetical protein
MNENDVPFSISFDDSATLSEVVTSTRASLNHAVELRRQAERDAQLLANRIQLLRNEEVKALKNIAITKARASHLESIKREAAVREAEKFQIDRMRQQELVEIQQRNAYLREIAKANRHSSIKQVQQTKIQAAVETKAVIRKTAAQKLREEENERFEASRRTDIIRRERIESKRRIEEEKTQRLRRFQKEFENRLADEQKQKEKAQAILAQLEREEMELIKRLQRAQREQSIVYEEVNSTLPSTPIPSGKSSPSILMSSSRASPRVGFTTARSQLIAAPTLASLSRRDVGGAALR